MTTPAEHLARAILKWAREPRDHGGVNPYELEFVKMAESTVAFTPAGDRHDHLKKVGAGK